MPRIIGPVAGRNFALVSPEAEGESLLSLEETLIKNLYMEHGALLFRGFACDVATFHALTSRFCSSYVCNESPGRKGITPDGRIQTVNVGNQPFSLHSELARQPWRPDVAWFACVNPPGHGGETLICDGISIVDNMPADTRNALEHRRLLYMRISEPTECQLWFDTTEPDDEMIGNPPENCPFRFARNGGQIFCAFTYPVLHKPMFSKKRTFANFLLFARFSKRFRNFPLFEDGTEIPDHICNEIKEISDKISVPVTWQRNDLLMLDNTRFMHGRNAIANAEERVILSQFGFLNFAQPNEEEPIEPPWRSNDTVFHVLA